METPVEEGGYPLSPVADRPPCTGYEGWPCEGQDATGEPLTYPGFAFPGIVHDEEAAFPNTGDVGLVVLDTALETATGFASLAVAGSLDVFATQRAGRMRRSPSSATGFSGHVRQAISRSGYGSKRLRDW